jgi:hypothetical protein
MSDEGQDKPKIIVDEDWKAQVESEREQLREQEAGSEVKPDAKPKAKENVAAEARQLPPASFATLVSSLATQAIASLGQIPDPLEGKPVVRLDLARHTIDTLDVLEQKTKGNLTPEEAKMLSNLLHELRMIFVDVQRQHVQRQPPPPIETPQA